MLGKLLQRQKAAPVVPRTLARSVSFVPSSKAIHSGTSATQGETTTPHVRGLRKDPAQYMHSPTGVIYPGNAETLEPVQKFIGEYKIDDSTLLQSVVHKSFAHAKVPYNEKLAILGQQLLRVEAHRALVDAEVQSKLLMNGQNFNVDQRAVELLTSSAVLSRIAKDASLDSALFWKPTSQNQNGIDTVRAKALHALVGAVLLKRGPSDAQQFIASKFLKAMVSVADSLYHP